MRNRLNSLNLGALRSPVILGVVGGMIVLIIIWWLAWMSPEASKLDTVKAQETSLQAQVVTLNQQITLLKAESKLVQRELPYLSRFQTAIPPTPDIGGLVLQIDQLANKTGVNMTSISDNVVVASTVPGGLSTIPVSFTVSGNHKQVFTFLTDFYSLPRLITIQSLTLSPGAASGTTPNINNVGDGASYGLTVAGTGYTTGAPPTPTA